MAAIELVLTGCGLPVLLAAVAELDVCNCSSTRVSTGSLRDRNLVSWSSSGSEDSDGSRLEFMMLEPLRRASRHVLTAFVNA